jgi:leucyl aminopeptidase (aminopeptidase T)
VGTNDAAQLTGNVLEDEKILGTVHIAFGASAGIGGTVSVAIHLDAVVLDATLELDGRTVLDAGRYVLD